MKTENLSSDNETANIVNTVLCVVNFIFLPRYKVYRFPSYLGTPIKTRTLIGAYIFGCLRSVKSGGYCEIRIIRIKDDKHVAVF